MRDRIRQVMSLVLEIPESAIDDDFTAERTTEWDSIRHLNLVMALEDAFGVTFPSDEIASLDSFGAIVDAVSRLSAA